MKNKTAAPANKKLFIIGAIIVAVGALGYGGMFLSHQNAAADTDSSPPRDLFQIQLGTDGGSKPNLPAGCSRYVSGWGTTGVHTSGGQNGEADCIQVRANPQVSLSSAYTQDFRVCLSADEGVSCTPWASQGGGGGNVAESSDGNIINASVWVELGNALPNKRISNVNAGVQFFYKNNNEACRGSSGAAFSNGYQESGWAYGEQKDNDPGCARAYLSVTVVDPPIYDAQHTNDSIPQSAGSDQSIAAEVSMQNDGNNESASWISDTTVSGTETATWTHADGTTETLANCSSYEPGPDAGTCTDTHIVTASNYKLKLTASTLPSFPAGAVFPYRNYVTTQYSSVFVQQQCGLSSSGGLVPIAENTSRTSRLLSFIIPRAQAIAVDPDEYPPNCDPNDGGWTLTVHQNRPTNITPGNQVGFPVAFNTNSVSGGDYTLTFSMVKLDGPAQGVRADGTFGQPFTAPIHIDASPGIGLICETAGQIVTAGGATQYTVHVEPQNGLLGDITVSLSGTGLPVGVSSPGAVATTTTSLVIPVFTSTSTPAGSATLTFVAKPTNAATPTASCQSQLVIRAQAGPYVDLSANPTTTIPGGQSVLTWNVQRADSCTASSTPANTGWTGAVSALTGENQKTVTLGVTTVFALTCSNGVADTPAAPVTVTVVGHSPTLTVAPSSVSTTINGPADFRAWYDADGSGSGAPVDVTVPAAWASVNTAVAQAAGTAGRFWGRSQGSTNITATYQGLSDAANVTVSNIHCTGSDCDSGGSSLSVTLTGAKDGVTWQSSLSGIAPFGAADLRAVTGAGSGTYNYTFYCNRSDDGTDITPDFAAKVDGTTNEEQIVRNLCADVYGVPGSYQAKVIVENGGDAAQAHMPVTVSECSGPACAGTLSCTFGASPATLFIPPPRSTALAWNCTAPTACVVQVITPAGGPTDPRAGTQVGSGGQTGSGSDQPTYTTTYRLSCGSGAVTKDQRVRVFDTNTRIEILPH